MPTLQELIDKFYREYEAAPKFKTYSQTLRKNLPTKSQVQSAFIDNIQMLLIISDDVKVQDKIKAILKRFE